MQRVLIIWTGFDKFKKGNRTNFRSGDEAKKHADPTKKPFKNKSLQAQPSLAGEAALPRNLIQPRLDTGKARRSRDRRHHSITAAAASSPSAGTRDPAPAGRLLRPAQRSHRSASKHSFSLRRYLRFTSPLNTCQAPSVRTWITCSNLDANHSRLQ